MADHGFGSLRNNGGAAISAYLGAEIAHNPLNSENRRHPAREAIGG
jgi:hypothetical protein